MTAKEQQTIQNHHMWKHQQKLIKEKDETIRKMKNLSNIDLDYGYALKTILEQGFEYEDPNRKDVRRKQIHSYTLSVDREYTPVISIRKTYFKGAVGELLLFLQGHTNIEKFHEYGVRFWDKDYQNYQAKLLNNNEEHAKLISSVKNVGYQQILDTLNEHIDKSSLGKFYPYQYSKQYSVFDNFKKNRFRTDLIVNSWQVDDLKDMCLIPCHYSFQFIATKEGFKIKWMQRSTDFLLGTPMNVQFYYLMGLILEKWSGHKFEGVIGELSNVHLYDNQWSLAEKMIDTLNKEFEYWDVAFEVEDENPPVINIDDSSWNTSLPFKEFIQTIKPSDFNLSNYNPLINESVEMLAYTD